jgi:hypothetical protein
MKLLAHTITLQPWQSASIGVRFVCEAASALLWPLAPDDRMTVLISLLAAHIGDVAETDDQIDAVIDVLRMQMKLIQH